MFLTHTILAQIDSTHAAAGSSTTSIVVVGFLFVMVVLTALTAVTSALGAYFSRQTAKEAAKSAAAALKAAEAFANKATAQPVAIEQPSTVATQQAAIPSTAQADTEDEDDPAFIAVIAAAVHSVIGDRAHRIVSVRSAGPGWAQEGRRQIFSSHRVR
ncbi:MAG: OadG family transporter subunit [Opitutaceae bacterium]